MNYGVRTLIYNKCRNILFQESKRYAGHSKWQNIKHTKEAVDAAKAAMNHTFINKMRIAISENGSVNPVQNGKLAQIIEQARKANVPVSTINTFLEKMKIRQNKIHADIMTVRGPGGCILILYITSSNIIHTKLSITTCLKKNNAQFTDSSVLRMFDCASYVLASKDCNLDQAMEDAININAEDVQEVNDNDRTCFQFKCEFQASNKSTTQLKSLGYSIVSVEDTCIPECIAELRENELKTAQRLKDRLLSFDEIEKIEDNIPEPEEGSE